MSSESQKGMCMPTAEVGQRHISVCLPVVWKPQLGSSITQVKPRGYLCSKEAEQGTTKESHLAADVGSQT